MTPTDLYTHDFPAWALQQAVVLRALAEAGALPAGELDIENVIEEVESLATDWQHKVEDALEAGLEHLILSVIAADDWRRQRMFEVASRHLHDASHRWFPSLDTTVRPDVVWRGAKLRLAVSCSRDRIPKPALPDEMPFSLAELRDDETNPHDLAARLAALVAANAPSHRRA